MFPLIKGTKQLKLESDDFFNNELIGNQNSLKPLNVGGVGVNNHKFAPLYNEIKLNEMETKLITLEQGNQFLSDQIRTNEKNFEIQLRRLGQQSDMEKDNRQKMERFVGMLTDQVIANIKFIKHYIITYLLT